MGNNTRFRIIFIVSFFLKTVTPFPPQIPYVLQVYFMNIKKKYGKNTLFQAFSMTYEESKFLKKDKHNKKLIKTFEIANVHKCINYVICVCIYVSVCGCVYTHTRTHNTHTYTYMGREIKSS